MSSIEKSMNKYDLKAYKNYDPRQFSLVPGLQHAKHALEPAGGRAAENPGSGRKNK